MIPKNRMLVVSSLILSLAALAHVLRILNGWQLTIGAFTAPMYPSYIAILVVATILFFNVKAYKQ